MLLRRSSSLSAFEVPAVLLFAALPDGTKIIVPISVPHSAFLAFKPAAHSKAVCAKVAVQSGTSRVWRCIPGRFSMAS